MIEQPFGREKMTDCEERPGFCYNLRRKKKEAAAGAHAIGLTL
jgi:hypothetical protein